jgi:uncharacterized protein (UPF0332 family)
MRKVAQHLESHAIAAKTNIERDEFGRSSFNRFYYATFLEVRKMLTQINPKWSEPAHKSLPDILRKALVEKFKLHLSKGVLPKHESRRLSSTVSTAASNLASLLEEGSGTRVVADYHPEIPVEDLGSVLELNGTKLSRASRWPDEADRNCAIILKAGRDLGLL